MSARRAPIAIAALALLAGCPAHLDRNAPGTIDVMKPPREIAREQVETPNDPGERVMSVAVGGFGGAGVRVGGDGRFAAEAGVEASVHWGELERSHERGTLVPVLLAPKRRGINAGWVFYEPNPDDSDDAELGPLYAEWYEGELWWSWSAGYSYDPQDDSHGPQLTVAGMGYYLKASYRFGRGGEALLGVVMKWPQAFVWSR